MKKKVFGKLVGFASGMDKMVFGYLSGFTFLRGLRCEHKFFRASFKDDDNGYGCELFLSLLIFA